jgi:hypothetical protein
MKLKLNNVKAIKKAAMLVAALSVAGLAGAGFEYGEVLKNIETAERDSVLTTKMVQTVRYDLLFKQLDATKADEAKQFLAIELESAVKQIKELAPATTADTKQMAGFVVAQVNRDARKSPDSRIASNQHVSVGEAAALVAEKAN